MNNRNRSKLAAVCSIGVLSSFSPLAFSQSGLPIVGVGDMTSSVPSLNTSAFQAMVQTQLAETQKFQVIEREQLQQILGEKALGQAGITGNGESVTNGGIKGVDYLVYGTITKLGQQQSGVALGGGALSRFGGHFGRVMGGGFATSQNVVIMAVDLRITDAHNGEIRYVGTVQEQVSSGGATRVGGVAVGGQAADPLSDVERLTAKAVVDQISTSIYPIKVITQEQDGSYVLNYGGSVLTAGDELAVYKTGESFKDPDTGRVLGAEETQVGLLKVIATEDQFSKAKLVSGSAAAGNVVKRLSSSDVSSSTSVNRGPALP
jgi:curli biogenesis system outer membrane secretion channel CsgG